MRTFRKYTLFVMGIFFLLIFATRTVRADNFENAYDFYRTYKNTTKFVPSSESNGYIYYGTKAKEDASAYYRYETLGWKVTLKDLEGMILQELYFSNKGAYIHLVDRRSVAGYEYILYGISLEKFQSRLNPNAKNALNIGNCDIVFDACTVVKINNAAQGGMNDYGIQWGEVHTSYRSIVNAINWSAKTKETLKSYYNKVVEDLFYHVNLDQDAGIESVVGTGRYCYGTKLHLLAFPKDGYQFEKWVGNHYDFSSTETLIVNRNIDLMACSKPKELEIRFFRNLSLDDSCVKTKNFIYHQSSQKFDTYMWRKEGYYQKGWSVNRSDLNAQYGMEHTVSDRMIQENSPNLDLFAVWKPNQYKLIYDGNGAVLQGSGSIQEVLYNDVVLTRGCEFVYEGAQFLGWSLNPLDREPRYLVNQELFISDLAEETGLSNSNGAEIRLYAIWDHRPSIYAQDLYVDLEDAKNGKITEEWIATYASAKDQNDGIIPYGKRADTSFYLLDYSPFDFLSFTESGSVTETFCAVDSVGNTCKKKIWVHVIDSGVKQGEEVFGKFRFFSDKYYKDESGGYVDEEQGGLWEDSIWKRKDDYMDILDNLYERKE